MEFKSDALLLRSAVFGENDKMVTLLTAERGKLSAAMKGVRRAGAKLSFASQPFCFAEYVFAERGGRYTVTGAALYDGFFSLRDDLPSLYAAYAVTQAADALLFEGMPGGEALVSAVRALGALAEGAGAGALVRYLLEALAHAGYPVRAGECPVCGRVPAGRMRFDAERGGFTCAACSEGVPASESNYLAVKAALGGEIPTGEGAERALRLLGMYLRRKTDASLPALDEYLRILRPFV